MERTGRIKLGACVVLFYKLAGRNEINATVFDQHLTYLIQVLVEEKKIHIIEAEMSYIRQ